MARRLISSSSRFEAEIGYSRAVVDDDWIFVSGTTGGLVGGLRGDEMAALNEPLTDAEYDRVASMLKRSERAMNLEMLDGFFAALICGPDLVRPSEYLRVIWGGDKIGGDKGWRDEAEMQEFFDLIMRHWNSVIAGLNSGEPFLPYLLEDDDGVARANDWAEGFARGMKLRTDGWTELFDDEMHAGFCAHPCFGA